MGAEREAVGTVAGVEAAAAPERFPCFDGLRALAASSVFAFHFLGRGDPTWLNGATRIWVGRLGLQGVAIFFVISGFLLYRPFVQSAFRGGSDPSAPQFWRRRFTRIMPAYWIALTVYAYGFGMFKIHGFANFVTYYALLQNYRGGLAMYGLGIAWTLAIEIGFYLAVPLISRIARLAGGEDPEPGRVLRAQLSVVTSLAAAGLLIRGLGLYGHLGATPLRGSWFPVQAVAYTLFGYLDWFAVGMVLAVAYGRLANAQPAPRWTDRLFRHPGTFWTVALLSYGVQTRLGAGPGNQYALTLLVELTAVMLVLPAVLGPQDRGLVRSLLRSRPLSYLGRISYGVYLWHFIIILLSLRWIASGSLPDVFVLRIATVGLLTVAVATASFYLVERPIISWSQHRKPPR